MRHIYLGFKFTVRGRLRQEPETYRLDVNVPDAAPVSVRVKPIEDQPHVAVHAFWETDISDDFAEQLDSGIINLSELTPELKAEAVNIGRTITKAVCRYVYGLKYYTNEYRVSDSVRPYLGFNQYSWDGSEWHLYPSGFSVSGAQALMVFPFGEKGKEAFAAFVNSDRVLLQFALRHLHRAKTDGDPRHKWIDATIAAELGIKEFLLRIKPELETLLIEMPSPPLSKMYGSILEHYANVKCPTRKELIKGAEIRNHLIHRPQQHEISRLEAETYVLAVEVALLHLLTLLNPEDEHLKRLFDFALEGFKTGKPMD